MEKLTVSISNGPNHLSINIESKEDLNLAIECLEVMYKKIALVPKHSILGVDPARYGDEECKND